jgi:uncharacterized protein (TIGR02270 family)
MRHALTTKSDLDSMVLTDIIEHHARDAAFLWHTRDTAVRSSAFDLEALHRLDDRVDAHLDGLRIAGDIGWEICKAHLTDPRAGEAFTATVLAVDRADVHALAAVLAHGARSSTAARGIVSGLGWAPLVQVRRFLNELLADDAPPELTYFGIAGSALHRHDPGVSLTQAVYRRDPRLQARSLRAVGELGRADLLPELRRELDSDQEACRFWAAWSAALLGEPAASDVLWRFAFGGGTFAELACSMAIRNVDPAVACAKVRELADTAGRRRVALVGAASLGDPELVPWVIESMATLEHARFAGWTFAMITGADLSKQKLDRQPPAGFRAGPSDDPNDPNVALDPDECLPWPDVDVVRVWWERRGTGFLPGRRLLLGKPLEPAWLEQVVRAGSQPARAAAAIELGLMRRGQPLFEVRAPGPRQQRILPKIEGIPCGR